MPPPDYVVTSAKVIGPHKLQLTFSDGTVGDVDFSAAEWTGVFAPLADPAYFATVSVDPEMGTVVWPNGADMAPDGLYDEVKAAHGSSIGGTVARACAEIHEAIASTLQVQHLADIEPVLGSTGPVRAPSSAHGPLD